jgi:hypothetical protein
MPRPQFSIKTLLWLTVIVAAFCAGTQLDRYLKESDPREANILAALDEKTELKFVDMPLADVVEYLKVRHDIEIQLDGKALSEAGIGSDVPITRSLKGITLRSALNVLLADLDMTFVVDNAVLTITTTAQARKVQSYVFSLKTTMWVAVAMAVLLGAILFGRAWGRRLECAQKTPELDRPTIEFSGRPTASP